MIEQSRKLLCCTSVLYTIYDLGVPASHKQCFKTGYRSYIGSVRLHGVTKCGAYKHQHTEEISYKGFSVLVFPNISTTLHLNGVDFTPKMG